MLFDDKAKKQRSELFEHPSHLFAGVQKNGFQDLSLADTALLNIKHRIFWLQIKIKKYDQLSDSNISQIQ